MTLTEGELGWAAGMIDGEGSLGVYWMKALKAYVLHMSILEGLPSNVVNTDQASLLLFKSWFGGSVQRKKIVCERYKLCWVWKANARIAARCLEQVLPYLRIKHKKATSCLSFQSLYNPRYLVKHRVPVLVQSLRGLLASHISPPRIRHQPHVS